jgi:serine/threonine-protein kinase
MPRPDAERRFLRTAQQEGYLTLEEAVALVERLEEKGEAGLHAIRDLAIRSRALSEKVAYRIFQSVSQELREVPEGIARIGSYEVLERVGRGSMGVVYRARHVSLGKEVALKILPPRLSQDPLFVERFLREARAAARLDHPNIVQALDAGRADGFYYFAMELVSGYSVKEIVEAHGPVEEREALKVAFFVAKALRHAHESGIIHRDIKPANIMVTSEGRVKLTDLGLARVRDTADCSLTQDGRSVGTPYYMSPEQAVEDRPVDARCDIYALGCTLFYMLTGRPPYDAPAPSGILAKHVSAPIPDARTIVRSISEPAARLVMHMMAKRPEQRPQTSRDVVEVLRAILMGREAAGAARELSPPLPLTPFGGAPRPESALSLPDLRAVSSGTLKRMRRPLPRSGRQPAASHGAPVAILAMGALILAGGALAFALFGKEPPAAPRRPDERAAAEAKLTASGPVLADRHEQAPAKAPAPARPPVPLAAANKPEEVLDREAAEREAAEREAKRPEIEAAKIGAEAEKLAALARAGREDAAKKAAAAIAARAEKEALSRAALLAEVAPRIAEGKFDEALARLERAAGERETEAGRARAERDVEALRAMIALRALALDAIEKKSGTRVELGLRSGAFVEGEIASVDRARARFTLDLSRGGSVEIAIEALSDSSLAALVQGVFGFSNPIFLLGEGLRLAYSGDPERGRLLLAKAAERGDERAARFLAGLDELPRNTAPPEVAASPPAARAPAAAPGGDGAARAPAAETSPFPAELLARLFEVPPENVSADGRVRFRYEFLGKLKRLGGDFEVAGGEVRFDPALDVLRLEGARRISHRAVFCGEVRVEAEIVFLSEPKRGSLLSLFFEDPKTRSFDYESIFGLALVERKKGKMPVIAGPKDALEIAWREIKPAADYRPALAIENGRAQVSLDGAIGGRMDGVPEAPRRAGLRFEEIDATIRSLTIEGKLDAAWVLKEAAKKVPVRANR